VGTARELRKSSPKTKVILLTQHDEDQYVFGGFTRRCQSTCFEEPGSGRSRPRDTKGLSRVRISQPEYFSRYSGYDISTLYISTDPLSGRARQVLQLVGEGKSTKDIAVQLGIAVKTAESHRSRLMKKRDIHETAGLVRYAIRNGLIQPQGAQVFPVMPFNH
jgi:DNA-binding NarL/FixJ family response regulator